MKLKILSTLLFVIVNVSAVSAQSAADSLQSISEILKGTWKTEGKDSFEVWEKDPAAGLKGRSYRIRNGVESVTEYLEISEIDGKVVYLATVPSQNKGATIEFTLSGVKDGEFIFENPEHDFPKKISYKQISKNEMLVQVTGAAGKGFSYKVTRIEN